MMKRLLIVILSICQIQLLTNCSKQENPVKDPEPSQRNFYIGFTPFPYDINSEAVNYVYDKMATDADIISHHFDDGIPWNEALSGDEFHPNVMAEWQFRLSRTPASRKILLSVTPMSGLRDSLARYKSDSGNLPLPPPWDTISFNHPDVKEAYFNYCTRIMEYFNPDYFLIGIEVNLLMKFSPQMWNEYLELHTNVYQQLKTIDPIFPISVSFTGMDLVEGYTDANHTDMMQALNDVLPFADYFGVSVYPFISNLLCDSLPNDMFNKIFSLSSKPICITETGYPAEYFTVLGGSLVFDGSAEKQNNYITLLLNEAEQHDLKFVINFVLRDYDALWVAIGSPDDINKLWRDTGLYDQDGNERIAHQTWIEWLNK
ncbi:MAG: hypothetical protein KJN64_08130 [Ignavibacteria bacterium]|nr:hypothetical protein [Ignavibacteria bacterium]MBT8391701.1 hypothetical protein [Ignavibacteria bacterium]NNL22744.1 hypothetical protein [Ignavibacteriaceae bacterium]